MLAGCKQRAQPGHGTPAPSASDRYADGARLGAALGEWRKRWQNEGEPPSCAALLTRAEEQRLCVEAAEQLVPVKARAAALDRSPDALREAAELARRAGRATQKLRFRNMEYMGSEGLSLAAARGSASAGPHPSASAPLPPKHPPVPKAGPSASGATDAGAPEGTTREDPYQPLIRAYGKLEVGAMRYLGTFLELGPLAERKLAFEQIRILWEEASRPPHTLQQIVRQASLLEQDPDFKAALVKLDRTSHLVPPAPSAK